MVAPVVLVLHLKLNQIRYWICGRRGEVGVTARGGSAVCGVLCGGRFSAGWLASSAAMAVPQASPSVIAAAYKPPKPIFKAIPFSATLFMVLTPKPKLHLIARHSPLSNSRKK
jgi:hypothetical protein